LRIRACEDDLRPEDIQAVEGMYEWNVNAEMTKRDGDWAVIDENGGYSVIGIFWNPMLEG